MCCFQRIILVPSNTGISPTRAYAKQTAHPRRLYSSLLVADTLLTIVGALGVCTLPVLLLHVAHPLLATHILLRSVVHALL